MFCVIAFGKLVGAHDWYDYDCCSDKDCEKTTAVLEENGGYTIVETGEFFKEGDSRIRWSKDQDFHRCRMTVNGIQKTRCLYRPTPGF